VAVCVSVAQDELPQDLRDALAHFECRAYGDVYRALANIERNQPALVLVDVTWLPEVALEFFDLLTRRRLTLPVFALAAERSAARMEDLVVRGVAARATAEGLLDCLPVHFREPATEPLPKRNKSDTFAPADPLFDAELDRRLREQADATQASRSQDTGSSGVLEPRSSPCVSDDTGPGTLEERRANEADTDEVEYEQERAGAGVRVPWSRYNDRPQRIPPKRVPPGAKMPPTPQPIPRPEVDPPLLTPEEIAALMGTDN